MAYDRHPIPVRDVVLVRDDGYLMALQLQGLGEIAEIPPGLEVQPARWEGLRDDRNPKGLHKDQLGKAGLEGNGEARCEMRRHRYIRTETLSSWTGSEAGIRGRRGDQVR